MSIESLSLFLDVLILLGLAATIYFALKLSKSLNNFRKQRKEFERGMQELNQNIEQAHLSLAQIKGFSGTYDAEAQVSLDEARELLDELKLMNQSGNNLADRLEHLASQSSYINQANEFSEPAEDEDDYDEQLYNNLAALEEAVEDDEAFSIQDREFDAPASDVQSTAEKELLQALKKNQKRASG